MKRCPKCKETKAKSEFSRDRTNKDGLQGWCKKCMSEYRKTPRCKAANKRYETSSLGKATRKQYEQSEARKASKKLRSESNVYKATLRRYQQSEQGKAVHKRYRQSPKGKVVRRRAGKRHRETYPEQTKAKNAVNVAVRAGRLPRVSTQVCKCGDQAVHYHHHSYEPEFWLDVEAVCMKCHTGKHQKKNEFIVPHAEKPNKKGATDVY